MKQIRLTIGETVFLIEESVGTAEIRRATEPKAFADRAIFANVVETEFATVGVSIGVEFVEGPAT